MKTPALITGNKARVALVVTLALFFSSSLTSTPVNAKAISLVTGGAFTPLFGIDSDQKSLQVPSFKMDSTPVTHEKFESFLKLNPKFFPKNISTLFSDQNYLKNWANKNHPPKNLKKRALTYVSWFAANAYCEAQGGRLPSVLEWEYAAAADEKKQNASKDPNFTSRLLRWYERPSQPDYALKIKGRKPNFYGIYDLHELVWEWTSDFNSVFVSGDNRQDGDKMKNFVCGAGSTNSSSKEDYAAFLRYAMRSSLRPEYSQHNLGFRCAYDIGEQKK